MAEESNYCVLLKQVNRYIFYFLTCLFFPHISYHLQKNTGVGLTVVGKLKYINFSVYNYIHIFGLVEIIISEIIMVVP